MWDNQSVQEIAQVTGQWLHNVKGTSLFVLAGEVIAGAIAKQKTQGKRGIPNRNIATIFVESNEDNDNDENPEQYSRETSNDEMEFLQVYKVRDLQLEPLVTALDINSLMTGITVAFEVAPGDAIENGLATIEEFYSHPAFDRFVREEQCLRIHDFATNDRPLLILELFLELHKFYQDSSGVAFHGVLPETNILKEQLHESYTRSCILAERIKQYCGHAVDCCRCHVLEPNHPAHEELNIFVVDGWPCLKIEPIFLSPRRHEPYRDCSCVFCRLDNDVLSTCCANGQPFALTATTMHEWKEVMFVDINKRDSFLLPINGRNFDATLHSMPVDPEIKFPCVPADEEIMGDNIEIQ